MAQAPEGRRRDNVLLGVGTIVGTVFALSLGDALIKSLGGGGTMGLWQLFAARYGGEIVGRMQWAGVVLGFFGILLVLAPGTEAFEWAALLPLLSAAFYAAAMVLTRTHCRDEHPATLALALNAMSILVGVAGLC